jgi:hypothetical protein
MLLESLILDCVGHLSSDREDLVQRLVQRVFPGHADWRTALWEEFGLQPDLREQVVGMWDQARRLAEESSTELSPGRFAEWVVEENFADTVEMVSAGLLSE